jgi:hypothetical protein
MSMREFECVVRVEIACAAEIFKIQYVNKKMAANFLGAFCFLPYL